jgi:hypothetical protein
MIDTTWGQALITDRFKRAQKLYESYTEVNCKHLTDYEKGVMDVLGWMSLETDDEPEPFEV